VNGSRANIQTRLDRLEKKQAQKRITQLLAMSGADLVRELDKSTPRETGAILSVISDAQLAQLVSQFDHKTTRLYENCTDEQLERIANGTMTQSEIDQILENAGNEYQDTT
jgi:Mg/Co/Ni transporter MgtE